ncbi:MAG: GyrI-like domain-containing protein [Balneolaceae bacterium]
MVVIEKQENIHLIGLALEHKTINENGQSGIDCGNLWTKFTTESCAEKIPEKLSDNIFAVYHEYEGDHTQPFSYFIGCKVPAGTTAPSGMDSLIIPGGSYQKLTAKGKMPDCIATTWKEIWKSDLPRAYRADFEIYDERSHDWSNAEVDIYLSVK